MKKLIIATFIICYSSVFYAQEKYEIKVKIDGLKDTTLNISYYYGKGQYYYDTTQVNSKGEAIFSKPDTIKEGLYSVLYGATKVFDFVGDAQNLSFSTTLNNSVQDMKVKGGTENQFFFDYLKFIDSKQIEAKKLDSIKKANKKDSKTYISADTKSKDLDNQVADYLESFYKKNENSFTVKFLMAMKPPSIPDAPVLENGKIDSNFQFKYFKQHYFDNIDLSDVRLLRTSVFHEKMVYYMDKLTYQVPDSIIKACDYILNEVKSSKELHKYTLSFLVSKYERSELMGMDAVFVHLGKNYIMNKKPDWLPQKNYDKIFEKVMTIDPLLIGKTAPNIIVKDTSMKKYIQLYDIEANYTIVYIWSPECGHCKEATPKLKKLYDKYRESGVEVFGIGNEFENKEWIKFINEHNLDWINGSDGGDFKGRFRTDYDVFSTPQTYLLDKDKKIISKKMNIESLEKILEYHMKKDVQKIIDNE